jgi:hypothetical protein
VRVFFTGLQASDAMLSLHHWSAFNRRRGRVVEGASTNGGPSLGSGKLHHIPSLLINYTHIFTLLVCLSHLQVY